MRTITIKYKRWIVVLGTKWTPFARTTKLRAYGKYKNKDDALAMCEYLKTHSRDYVDFAYITEREFQFDKVIGG
jgi:pyruvate/2-oxoacid:ferredoxin oxidoreductase beta subunit